MSKALIEKRNDLVDEMERKLNTIKAEKRNHTQREMKRHEEIRAEINKIDEELDAEQRERGGIQMTAIKDVQSVEQRHADEQAFLTLIKENRATGGMSAGSNGVVIPVSIAQRIVETAKNVSPLLKMATVWTVSGDLQLPNYDYTQNVFQYVTEGVAVTDSNGAFAGPKLTNFIVGSLSKISNSLINRADIDVVPIIVRQIGLSLALFLENELINETGAKLRGLKSGVTTTYMATNATAGVIDAKNVADLITLQMKVPQVFQANAAWLMNPTTWTALRSLTATTGQLLIQGDDSGISADGGLTLFGKKVLLSDQMPTYALNNRAVYYGEFDGLDVKMTTAVQIKVLIEKFADSYQTGIVCFQELDSVVGNPAKLACLVGK